MAELTTMQSVKQSTRNFMHKASDKMKVTGAKVGGGDTKDLDIAIVKATTSNFHVVPKEKHIRTLKSAVHSSQPRRDVMYVITELHKRLQNSTDWLTALKTLITLHRLMRETGASFLEELVKQSSHLTHGKGRLLNMDNFIDRTNIEGRFDYSEWVRAYGKYLDEQLETYSGINWYVEQEQPGSQSRMRTVTSRDLIYQLPFLQRLQRRLLDCVPKGQAAHDAVVLFALGIVVKESFTLYRAVSEGIINLADTFFEMDYLDAVRGLELYKESIASNEALASYYATIEQIEEVKRSMQLPKLSAPPLDFVKSMEAYVQEAPRSPESEAHKKAPPLRKGKLVQATKRASSVLAADGAAKDPGMVLAVGLPSTTEEPTPPAQTASSSAATAAAAAAPVDLLGFGDLSLQGASGSGAATPAAMGSGKKPTPLDLLSGLDFSYPDDTTAGGASYGGSAVVPAAPVSSSSNPFAAAPSPVQQRPLPVQQYGAPSPLYGGAYQTYSMPGTPGAYPASGQYMPSPIVGHVGGSTTDFGIASPSPVSNSNVASPGGGDSLGSSSSNPLRASGNGLIGTPGRSPSNNVDLFKAAGAHDPFASLTGIPKTGTPGSTKPSPTKPSPSISPNASTGNLFI